MKETPKQEKKKISRFQILALILIVLSFAGYEYYDIVLKPELNGSTLIDNPTNNPISVTIDNKNYNIPANTYTKIDIELGHHKIDCKDYSIAGQDLNIDPVEYGVINPTKSKYVVYNIIYTEKDLKSQFKPYQVEGREIYSLLGEPVVTTDLFIPDRTLGKGNIDDKEPSFDSYNKMNQDYSYIMKIFRLKDFFEFYDKTNK